MLKLFLRLFLFGILFFPYSLYASFIESTIGTAVVNDATATYYNPAALVLMKSPQVIGLGSVAYFRTHFTGQATQLATGTTFAGSASTQTNYYLPSLYIGYPFKNIVVGMAVISNIFNRDIEANSILRYVQASNSIQDIDFVPGVGIKFNEYLSLGAGLNITYARFVLEPVSGFNSLNVPDALSKNDSSAKSWGADAGILLRPTKTTLIGFNYRGAITYNFSGTSTLQSTPSLTSNNYNFTFWTPARSVVTISQQLTNKFGVIATAQWIQWSVFNKLTINGIATRIGLTPVILSNANVFYHFHNSWIFTLGGQYRATDKCILRLAGSYNQSPGNPHYQLTNGNSIILGGSVGYKFNKYLVLDGSYAHAFIKNQTINIRTAANQINGINSASRNSVSLKITLNVV